jgi:hypothetical protein
MFLGEGSVRPLDVVISITTSLAIVVSGLLIFQKVERTFVDTI